MVGKGQGELEKKKKVHREKEERDTPEGKAEDRPKSRKPKPGSKDPGYRNGQAGKSVNETQVLDRYLGVGSTYCTRTGKSTVLTILLS